MTALQTQSILQAFHRELQVIYGDRLAQLLLYGSQARGDASPDSDIDLLVILNDEEVIPSREISKIIPIVARYSLEHDLVLSCAFVSSKRYSSENSPFILNVRREGLAVA